MQVCKSGSCLSLSWFCSDEIGGGKFPRRAHEVFLLENTIKWREQRPKAKTTNFPLLFCSRCTGRVFRVVLGCEFGIPPLPPCCTPPFKTWTLYSTTTMRSWRQWSRDVNVTQSYNIREVDTASLVSNAKAILLFVACDNWRRPRF